MQQITKISSCRVCAGRRLTKVISLGATPLANAFLSPGQADGPEPYFPLELYLCQSCGFLELGHVVDPVLLFGNYVYVSSTSPVFIRHFEEFARSSIRKLQLHQDSLVIDIGSNDGILLVPFAKSGMRVLGIEPAKKIAAVARKKNIETVSEFFSVTVAKRIRSRKGLVKVITATNVFAHIDDLDEVIQGLDVLLDTDGVFIMEAPYIVDFLTKRYFDLVYHEHLSYWAVGPLIRLFKRFGMRVFDVDYVKAHGGSIRVFVARTSSKHTIRQSVGRFLAKEKKLRVGDEKTYQKYQSAIMENRVRLLSLLAPLVSSGKKIVGYGAPAKGNTLLNYFNIGTDTIRYIVDDSTWKQGLYTPGKRIPVVSPSVISKDKPDYMLILAWNFAESIMAKNQEFKKNGGKFIIPVPRPVIV